MTAQELAVTQTLADAAASKSRAAWMVTGRHASYLLAQANTAAIRGSSTIATCDSTRCSFGIGAEKRVSWLQLGARPLKRGMKQRGRSLVSRSVVPMGGDVTVSSNSYAHLLREESLWPDVGTDQRWTHKEGLPRSI